ncbi:hypothetical protein [Mesobacillus jeotgali]|uniref:hypothetical protein n=1 Tax=Mesobacillus jeotgali TaxID=129985 RepID=UPI00178024E5|nr:hypothetical protein [Mesobacillus jeotgali]UYZ21736.1 hypothetical protein FOF60_22520 [Mesobacillus jeotgali]
MGSWNKYQQVCASCRYWAGHREIDFTATHFNALEPAAQCQKPFGPFYGVQMGEGSYCPQWENYN